MKAANTFETHVNFYRTTLRNNPKTVMYTFSVYSPVTLCVPNKVFHNLGFWIYIRNWLQDWITARFVWACSQSDSRSRILKASGKRKACLYVVASYYIFVIACVGYFAWKTASHLPARHIWKLDSIRLDVIETL